MLTFNRTQNPPFCEGMSISSEYGTMRTSYSKNKIWCLLSFYLLWSSAKWFVYILFHQIEMSVSTMQASIKFFLQKHKHIVYTILHKKLKSFFEQFWPFPVTTYSPHFFPYNKICTISLLEISFWKILIVCFLKHQGFLCQTFWVICKSVNRDSWCYF